MKIKPSNSINSSIVAEGMRLQAAMKESGQEYLMLNRGVNSVVNIDLRAVIETIDFNSPDIQVYPGAKGKQELRQAINNEYFAGKADIENILITGGGISGLDTSLQNLDIDELWLPPYFWGTYLQICQVRNITCKSYPSYGQLFDMAAKLAGKAVIICDPGNPLGEKYPDNQLLDLIKELSKHGVTVLFDSPYRRLFFDRSDTFYQHLFSIENVIIIESFSKSVGLSGQRIGFIHSTNASFNSEAVLRLMYATNGINSFAQILVAKLLDTPDGQRAVANFKRETTKQIEQNIKYLQESGLLAQAFYTEAKPLGIFALIAQTKQQLFDNRIGSVGLDYFVLHPFPGIEKYSRILVSYPHEKFVSYCRNLR